MPNGISAGITLIKRWEQCRLVAYPDPATGNDPWTIGWGATGPDIVKGTIWTQEQADADLWNRISLLANKMHDAITYDPTEGEFGAMLSLAYNIGFTAFQNSTLLRLFNEGEVQQAADAFLSWDHAGGRVMQGLLNRRKDERNVFLS